MAPDLGLQDRDVQLQGGEAHFIEECSKTGPNQTIYWYKDGRDITQYYDVNTGRLSYNVNIDPNLYGVYQCFLENEAGSDYVIFRALPRCELTITNTPLSYCIMPYTDFANPPSNFSCVAVDRESNYLLPKLLVSWGAPPLISHGGGNTRSYIVRVNNDCYDVGSSNCAEILLRADKNVICSVFLDLDPIDIPGSSDPVSSIAGAVAMRVDNINTAEDRRISKSIQCVLYHGYYYYYTPLTDDPVIGLIVNCSSSHVSVYLPSPELPTAVCVENIHLWALCLYQGSVYRVGYCVYVLVH